jgi:hypothetical protein
VALIPVILSLIFIPSRYFRLRNKKVVKTQEEVDDEKDMFPKEGENVAGVKE